MNAIIAAAVGYMAIDLAPFLRSVAENCPNATLFLMIDQQDEKSLAPLLAQYDRLTFLPTRKKAIWERILFYPSAYYLSRIPYAAITPKVNMVGRYPLQIHADRFFIALEFVKSQEHRFSNILLTDTRDVVIQKDPFSFIKDRLISGGEAINIGHCHYNTRWIKSSYGKDVCQQMTDNQVICSGVTLGPTEAITHYLTAMCQEVWKCLPKLALDRSADQGFHNYLIFKKKIDCQITNNDEGIIATIGCENRKDIDKDETTGFVQVHGKIPAIVHQYDRHPDLMNFLHR